MAEGAGRLGCVDIYIYTGHMSAIKLSPEQWSRVLEFLRSQPDLYVGQESDCKRFIEAIIWMSRSGAPWRLLPSEYEEMEQRPTSGLPDGVRAEYGNECISISSMTLTWST